MWYGYLNAHHKRLVEGNLLKWTNKRSAVQPTETRHWSIFASFERLLAVYFIMGVGQLATVAFGYMIEKEDGSSKETKGHTLHAWYLDLRVIKQKSTKKAREFLSNSNLWGHINRVFQQSQSRHCIHLSQLCIENSLLARHARS